MSPSMATTTPDRCAGGVSFFLPHPNNIPDVTQQRRKAILALIASGTFSG
jgi:hypothetical protein